MKWALALILATGAAQAQEFITASNMLSDNDFYRLVSCAAPPNGDCQKEVVRWSATDAQDVSIGFVQIEPGYPQDLVRAAQIALASAISELNAADANLHVTLGHNKRKPDIGIHLLTIVEGDKIRNTGPDLLDGEPLEAAKIKIWWREDHSLIEGAIVFGKDINPAALPSVMLEEVTQAMGLLTDIGGTVYESQSIFSESSNQLTTLSRQDVMALRRHYPKSQ